MTDEEMDMRDQYPNDRARRLRIARDNCTRCGGEGCETCSAAARETDDEAES